MAKKKEPAKAGDIGTAVGGVKALIGHLESYQWMAALGDIQAIWKEIAVGIGVPGAPAMAKLSKLEGTDHCEEEAVATLCKGLNDCCDEIEECAGDEKKIAKAMPDAPAQAGGAILLMLLPYLAQALQAILAGLLKKQQEEEAAK